MMKFTKEPLRYGLLGVAIVILLLCVLFSGKRIVISTEEEKGETVVRIERDWPQIVAEGKLRVVTEYDLQSCYFEGDTLTGFHYDLVNAFARDHNLQIEIIPNTSHHARLQGVANGTYDLIAYSMPGTTEMKDSLLLTTPIVMDRPVLVQRKPMNRADSLRYVRSPLDLALRHIYVVFRSPDRFRLYNLIDEIADTIYVVELERYGHEQLISLVAHRNIDYAVCDEHIARAITKDMPNIDISVALGFNQFQSWAVSKQSPILCDSLNAWLEKFKTSKEFNKFFNRYYR